MSPNFYPGKAFGSRNAATVTLYAIFISKKTKNSYSDNYSPLSMLASTAFFLLAPFLAPLATADCPTGSFYDSYFDKCYEFVNSPKSFLDAEQYCNSLGGHLADEGSAFESSYIAEIAGNSGIPSYWIGANLLRSSNWTWTSNAPMVYTHWAADQPYNSYPCAFVESGRGTWATSPCNTELSFICKTRPTNPQPETCPPCPTCATDTCPYDSHCTNGYTLYTRNCLCYKFVDSAYLFYAANTICENEGGMLAKITSKDVNDFLTVLPGYNTNGNRRPWIGLSCASNSANNCSWIDGSPLGNYVNFDNLIGSGNFVLGSVTSPSSSQDGKWIGTPEKSTQTYLCQKESTRANLHE